MLRIEREGSFGKFQWELPEAVHTAMLGAREDLKGIVGDAEIASSISDAMLLRASQTVQKFLCSLLLVMHSHPEDALPAWDGLDDLLSELAGVMDQCRKGRLGD